MSPPRDAREVLAGRARACPPGGHGAHDARLAARWGRSLGRGDTAGERLQRQGQLLAGRPASRCPGRPDKASRAITGAPAGTSVPAGEGRAHAEAA